MGENLNSCQNCNALKAQCDQLRNEVEHLKLRLDAIVKTLSSPPHDLKTVSTQTVLKTELKSV